ncbi:BMC domain-containing protein [Pseudogracilibacillus auburnensis]|uniref:Microcompartment protein CcmL/EutN n=1 Tax=Pseudogracilibacillus auburnensis TaxID=1494959 RepID=A0A2V3WL10_9BACI|nr:microcompartment protein CcmL/EutN [Pseudogracilibacillus auburnensis]
MIETIIEKEVWQLGKALGMIETRGLIGAIEAADVMLKTANVSLVKSEKIGGALVSVYIEGDVGAVKASVDAGIEGANKVGDVVAHHIIPHPDEEIERFLKGRESYKKSPTNKKHQSKSKSKSKTSSTVKKRKVMKKDE